MLLKFRQYFLYSIFILSIFIFFDLLFSFMGFGYPRHYEEENIHRYPSPYDMFAGKPNVAGHNSQGFKGLDINDINADKNMYRIAFFGGSTGYNGQPPIVDRIGKSLSDLDLNTQIFNFSSISSNHNQHIHRLVKVLDKKFDLVIFYGGGNESLQNYLYDSRPGYPYNFFIRNELSPLKLFLLRYSAFFGEFDKVTGLISNQKKLTNKDKDFKRWVRSISDNYVKTHNITKTIVEKSIKPHVCSSTLYLPVLQPILTKNDKLNYLYDELSIDARNHIDGLVDLRHLTGKLIFLDYIHIDNNSKQIISDALVPTIKNLLEKCNI